VITSEAEFSSSGGPPRLVSPSRTHGRTCLVCWCTPPVWVRGGDMGRDDALLDPQVAEGGGMIGELAVAQEERLLVL